MDVFITGGLGFVGRHLSSTLLELGHRVTAVGRRKKPDGAIEHPNFSYLAADTTVAGDWQKRLADHDVVINLAGKSIFTLWTAQAKRQIYDSRILTTRHLAEALADKTGETVFLSTSAVGYYGERGEDVLTETEPVGGDFLACLARDWEREALRAQSPRTRVVLCRFAIVLHRDGGAMTTMIPAFRLCLGGRLGSGRQWFPWIHLDDLIDAYLFVLDHPEIAGPVNWCAPHPVRNQDLTERLARRLKRPAILPVPEFVMNHALGEFGRALTCSQRAQPAVLQKADFLFTYGEIDSALDEIVLGG